MHVFAVAATAAAAAVVLWNENSNPCWFKWSSENFSGYVDMDVNTVYYLHTRKLLCVKLGTHCIAFANIICSQTYARDLAALELS